MEGRSGGNRRSSSPRASGKPRLTLGKKPALTRMTLMDTCRDPATTEDPIPVFDAFGPIGFVMKFAADDWES
jgi:hypothetical protein